jgi:DNA-binding HxlR family transcriptional regulator
VTVQIKHGTSRKLIAEDYLSLTDVPPELFNPCRMLIMQDLTRHGIVEYRELKHSIPGMTDGNLASHLKVLEQAGYVQVQKEIVDRKIRTSYEITGKGLKVSKQLMKALSLFYKEVGSCNE